MTQLLEKIRALPAAQRKLVADFIAQIAAPKDHRRRPPQDLTIINRHAARLNREAAAVLDYQAPL